MDVLLGPYGTRGRARVLLGLVPVLGVLGAVPLWHLWRRAYWGVVGEDHLAELLTVAAYVPAAVLSAVVAMRLHRSGLRPEALLWALLAVGAFFVAGEEFSWGQRQLGFAGPDALVERNVQGEANLHNLLGKYGLHTSYIVVCAYAAFGARLLVPRLPRLGARPWLFVPQRDLAPWFGVCLVYYVWATYLSPVLVAVFGPAISVTALTGPKLQESAELALAVGVLLFTARTARRHRPDLPVDADGPQTLQATPA